MIAHLDFAAAGLEALPARQKTAAIVLAVGLLLLVLELVRRRKLREEYSLMWVVTSVGVLLLAVVGDPVVWLSQLVGAANPASTLFLGALLFLLLLALQFSIRLSKLTYRNKALGQRVALMEEELRRLQHTVTPRGASTHGATSGAATADKERRRKGGAA